MNCYKFVEYNFDRGLFDVSIDATYVIHLENNGRINQVIEQIYKYKPTKKIYILYNKGFKNCNKILEKNEPDKDLVHCNLTIFKHAKLNNYDNILILEDDFIFNDKIKNKDILQDLNYFFYDKKKINFIYYIGGIPIFSIYYKKNHYVPLFIGTTHCCVFSKKAREILLSNSVTILRSFLLWDLYLNQNNNINKYHYKYPLCYQIFPVTENQKKWNFSNNSHINKIIKQLNFFLLKLLNLDKKPEPGFTIIYNLSIVFFYIFIFFIIYIIYKYIQIIIKKVNV